MGLFKKKDGDVPLIIQLGRFDGNEVTANDIGFFLVERHTTKTNLLALKEHKKRCQISTKHEEEKYDFELKMLSVVANLFAIKEVFNNPAEEHSILASYYQRLLSESKVIFHLEPNIFEPILRSRVSEYEAAWKIPHPEGPMFMIGKTFMNFVGNLQSMVTCFNGGMFFQACLMATLEVLHTMQKNSKILLSE